MTEEEILELIRTRLTVRVHHKAESDFSSGEIRVKLLLDDEIIHEDWDYVFGS